MTEAASPSKPLLHDKTGRSPAGPAGYIAKIGEPKAAKGDWTYESGRSAAEILVQEAEQQMILPDPVDAEIAAGKPLA